MSLDTGRLKLLSFDVFGTLVNVREGSYGAFERILKEANAAHVDVKAFWEVWEENNIARYWQPYRCYKDICRESLAASFELFGVKGRVETIAYYFDAFPGFALYPDVVATLDALARRFKLAIVSNIDDDLLATTPLAICWQTPVSPVLRSCTPDSRNSRTWSGPSRSVWRSHGSIAGASH